MLSVWSQYYNFKRKVMFGWVSRCWGGLGVNSQFERARIRSIITDWKVPDDQDLYVLISTFKGQNTQISSEFSIDFFLKQMQIDEERNNPIFILKHLFILDHATQSLILLDKISNYESTEFFNFKTGSSIEITPIRQLVASYYLYVKKKAGIYMRLDHNLLSKKDDRIHIMQKYSNSQIFSLIDKAFEIQKHINEINLKYKGKNKSVELIQMVFAMLLKTYLFCYTIISTCVRIFFKRLLKMTKNQAVKMQKFIIYFNKQYTRNFVDFIESNKEIDIYRSIKYSELILIDKSYVQYLHNHITNIQNKPASLIGQEIINVEEEEKIEYLPQEILNKISQELKINYQPKKMFKLKENNKNTQTFYKFANLFSVDYDSEYETSMRYNYNQQLEKSQSGEGESKMFKTRKICYESLDQSHRFNEGLWNQHRNVYAS